MKSYDELDALIKMLDGISTTESWYDTLSDCQVWLEQLRDDNQRLEKVCAEMNVITLRQRDEIKKLKGEV